MTRLAPLVVALAASLPAAASAQAVRRIGLDEVMRIAADSNPDATTARLAVVSADAAVTRASAFAWPTLDLTATGAATDDPVGVFGARLRQGRFTQADLALDALNHPAAVTDWGAAATFHWQALDAARWAERNAARSAADAVRHAARRAGEAAVFTARLLYVDAVRAEARLSSAEVGEAAAVATVDRLTRRRGEGLGTDADVLQAQAALAGARAGRIQAQAAVADARSRLGVHLGWPADVVPVPTDPLAAEVQGAEGNASSPGPEAGMERRTPAGQAARGSPASPTPPARSDLRASLARLVAARARVSAARAKRLPVAEAFLAAGGHAASDLDGQVSWSAGVQVSVPVFSGFAVSADVEAALAEERTAAVDHARRVREADAAVADARRAVTTARRGLEAARAASDAAEEARRLVRRRFEEGLATVDEMLGAEARASGLRTAAVDALAALHVAAATLEFQLGKTSLPADFEGRAGPTDVGDADAAGRAGQPGSEP